MNHRQPGDKRENFFHRFYLVYYEENEIDLKNEAVVRF
jgi:hypothetical protein